jgi:tRNA (uracil-5-)-methyltransferase TRM9
VDQFKVWNRIASGFDATRQRTWPHVEAFIDSLPPAAGVLDLMCGNGRHLRPGIIGVDWSEGLCQAASSAGEVVRGDAATLPFADDSFDASICVAALHGLPDSEARDASLRELRRVVKPGGLAQVTVWSRDAPRFATVEAPGATDVVVPWRRDGLDEHRTYHLYTKESLAAACQAAGWQVLEIPGVAIAAAEPDNLAALLRA